MITNVAQACPECEEPVELAEAVRLNEIVECAGCRSELEIVALDPPVLALAPEVEEDWGE
ncbi:lysine biosynthesis protein LysW [Catenulispora acidiphila DSM 44928]|uniref:Lysine biosynthesis protein LysW n=1 Tax=Catenulispora acidiphila (strain DSM 44928 / JCM 14897 / NBRC 102108 / NRRL B-24433 / ID139908) TaxID=479433 RepID=C7QK76_CATAD|nr:lysine biosynthesis protein LysW [Catenulispora acidiphila]ACU75150.1 lysine biosynthesis protein LysW [Catenulispora acidiphila DSM 44928]